MPVPDFARARRRLIPTVTAAVAVLLAGLPAMEFAANPAAAASSTGPYCGPTITKNSGEPWKCTFADGFSGTSLRVAKWSPMTTAATGIPTKECRTAKRSNIGVGNGVLRLTVRRESASFLCKSPNGDYRTRYTGGSVTTYNKFSQTYGRVAIRAKFPSAKVAGLHSALWMWPQSMVYGAASGELDIAEFRTAFPNRAVPFIHYVASYLDPNTTSYKCYVSRPDRFHVYVMEWTKRSITIKYDGKVCLVNRRILPALPLLSPAPFDKPFVINLTQSLGIRLNAFNSATPLPASMRVDYVRVWR
jgi:beta-glucanase (GH16 family)